MITGGFKNMNADQIIQCILVAMLKLEKIVNRDLKNKLDRGGYSGTAQDLANAIGNLQTEIDNLELLIVPAFPKRQFTADGIQNTFDLTTTALVNGVLWNGVPLFDEDWSQTSNILTLTFAPNAGAVIKPI